MCLGMIIPAQAGLTGDVNKDGEVNSADALEILTYSVGKNPGLDLKASDVDGNGRTDAADALLVLRISVGSYQGDPAVPDSEKHLKEELLDPVLKTLRYRYGTEINSGGENIPAEITVNGTDVCCEMKYSTIDFRLLIKDGKAYVVFPDIKVYCPIDTETQGVSSVKPLESTFVKAEERDIDGRKYVVETYSLSDGSVSDYYFLDGKWVRLETTDKDGNVKTQIINGLTGDIDETLFSLNGMKKTDLSVLRILLKNRKGK